MTVTASTPSSALATTSAASTESWQEDLKTLFDHAKERFPDVVWELTSDFDAGVQEDVWGHKGESFVSYSDAVRIVAAASALMKLFSQCKLYSHCLC